MINNLVKGILYFVILILVQVLLLNNIYFFRVAIPFLYIYFILKLPVGVSRVSMLILSFITGLTIDAFSNSPGLHAAACTFIGFVREYVINLYLDKDLLPDLPPSFKTFGVGGFFRYTLTLVILHHTALFMAESFSFFDPVFLFVRLLASVILTTILICTFEAFNIQTQKSGE